MATSPPTNAAPSQAGRLEGASQLRRRRGKIAAAVIVYAVVDDALSPDFPLGSSSLVDSFERAESRWSRARSSALQ